MVFLTQLIGGFGKENSLTTESKGNIGFGEAEDDS